MSAQNLSLDNLLASYNPFYNSIRNCAWEFELTLKKELRLFLGFDQDMKRPVSLVTIVKAMLEDVKENQFSNRAIKDGAGWHHGWVWGSASLISSIRKCSAFYKREAICQGKQVVEFIAWELGHACLEIKLFVLANKLEAVFCILCIFISKMIKKTKCNF